MFYKNSCVEHARIYSMGWLQANPTAEVSRKHHIPVFPTLDQEPGAEIPWRDLQPMPK